MKRKVYDHGLPFSKGLDKALDEQIKRLFANKASLIIIDGGIGEGKTTLGVHIGKYCQEKIDPSKEFSLKNQLSMGGEHFQEKLRICYDLKLSVCVYDEAGDFNSRGVLTGFNRQLNRVFDTYRAFKILVILILPSFSVLDSSLFHKKIPRLLLHCQNRSYNYGRYRAYSLYRMFYIRDKMRKLIVKSSAYKFTTPNFIGQFLDLPKKEREALDKMSLEGKLDIISEGIIAAQGLRSYKDLAKALSRSEMWVRYKIKELKIDPVKTFKKKKYFDGEILSRLEVLRG